MFLHDNIISGFLYAFKPITIEILNVHEDHMHNCTIAFIILVKVLSMEYMCHKLQRICSIYRKHFHVFMCGLRNDFLYRVFAIVLYKMELNRFWLSVFKNMLHEI